MLKFNSHHAYYHHQYFPPISIERNVIQCVSESFRWAWMYVWRQRRQRRQPTYNVVWGIATEVATVATFSAHWL